MYKGIVDTWCKLKYDKMLEDGEQLEWLENEMENILMSIINPVDPTNITAAIFYQTRYLVLADLYNKVKKELQ